MKTVYLTLTIMTAWLLAATATAATPPPSPTGTLELSRVHYPMEAGNTIGDAMALAAEQALHGGTGPKYPSNPGVGNKEYTAFEGSVTFSAPEALAIFSDDGCRVTIKQNGATICFFDRYGKGQHLPSLSQSFHILPVTLQANVTYHIEVWYSNILYRGTTDIDGATLFSFDPPLEFVDMDGEKVSFATSFSDPHPVVSLEVVNVEVINDSTRPPDHPLGAQTDLVAITFRGTVVDALADIVEGGKANISQVFVHGHSEPISVEPDPNEVNFRSSLRPYPFKGRFEKTVILPLTNGYNALVVTATNVLGNTGANTIGIEAFVEYELGEENGEIVIVAGKAYVDTVEVEGGTEVGLTNPIRVYVNDSSVQPESVANAKLRFLGQDFGLEFKDDQLQADRPFMVVAKPVPADIPNVINLLNHPDATLGCYRGYCTSLAWAYTAHSPPAQFKYASGTSITHQIISDEFKRLSATDIAGLPRIVTRNGQPDDSVDVLDFDIVDVPGNPKVRALRMTLKLEKNAHINSPTKSIFVDVNGRPKPLSFKDNLRAVPVKVVICAVDGGGYEALKFAIKENHGGDNAANFKEVLGTAENWNDPAYAHLPSVTWCNWSSVFSGNDPKGHGILGNAFFGREWDDGVGAATPFACAGAAVSDGPDALNVTLGGLKDLAATSSGSLYDKVRDEVPAIEPLTCASVNIFYSKSTKPNVTMKRLHYPGSPFRRKSTYFAFLVPPVGVALLIYREVALTGHSGDVATRLDRISAEDAIRLWSSNPSKVPDVVSIYFPGPDNFAHHVGTTTLGGVLVGAITQHFVEKTDAEFGRFLKHIKDQGYQNATLFALTADHGLIGATISPSHVVTIGEVDNFFFEWARFGFVAGNAEWAYRD